MLQLQTSTTVSSGEEDRKKRGRLQWLSSRLRWDVMVWLFCAPLNRNTGPHWTISPYTTTGQFAAVSSAHKTGSLYNNRSGASGKNKSTVSPCNVFSLPHKAHILITSNRSNSTAQCQVEINNYGQRMLCSEIAAVSLASMHLSACLELRSFLVYSAPRPWSRPEYLQDDTWNQGHICTWKSGARVATAQLNIHSTTHSK